MKEIRNKTRYIINKRFGEHRVKIFRRISGKALLHNRERSENIANGRKEGRKEGMAVVT